LQPAAIPPAEFSAFLDWLEVRPQTPVMTMREVLALPAVRRPVRARR